ncbi:MAG: hypothetical protein MHPDNHAH_01349 [Anaerolineales bacterium]|nr:hypothetical protein [Anaerolineales bacterium]WKZ46737.1 MAG: hypothetical protein QY306_13050 [Anaerolineales bacterium]
MEALKEYRYTVSATVGVLVCCVFTIVFLPRPEEMIAPTPLSNVVLQPSDLIQNTFEQKAPSTECNKYLSPQIQSESIEQSLLECYQVKFTSYDDNIIVLNAIWIFNDQTVAKLELAKLLELSPNVENVDISIVPVSGELGETSGASIGVITGGKAPLYFSNLYWQQGSAIVRLSALNYQGLIDLNSMMGPAKNIEQRLTSR